jgi:hypothetical protein
MCVLHGAKYVFVSDGKVLMLKNQDFAGLKQYAGDQVTLSGDRSGIRLPSPRSSRQSAHT